MNDTGIAAVWLATAAAIAACKATTDAGAPDDSAVPGKRAPVTRGESAPTPPDHGPVSSRLSDAPASLAQRVRLRRVVTGLQRPLGLEVAPGDTSGRLYIVEQTGRVQVWQGDGALRPTPLLDVSKLITLRHNEQGLLGLAFHPGFAANRRLFINYTDRRGRTRVVEYRVRGEPGELTVDPDSARLWLSIDQPWGNHNGGYLEFGPDGGLYIGTGDGGAAGDPRGAAQDPQNLLGKMLRLDTSGEPAAPEIVARGLRNPWRYHFDYATSDLYIADVGQNKWEWVFVVPKGTLRGKNFGWNTVEGGHCFRSRSCDRRGLELPVVEYTHSEGCSITGGHVYRGHAIPELVGVYFYADYCTGLLRSFRWSADGVRQHWNLKPVLDPDYQLATISAFGVDARRELYLVSLDGDIYKLEPK